MQKILKDLTEFVEVRHGSTRGDREIDRYFLNFGQSIVESEMLEPQETKLGQPSDHSVARVRAEFQRQEQKVISYS